MAIHELTITPMTPSRRGLIKGLGLLLAAPAIVRVSSLMPVRAYAEEIETVYLPAGTYTIEQLLYSGKKLYMKDASGIWFVEHNKVWQQIVTPTRSEPDPAHPRNHA